MNLVLVTHRTPYPPDKGDRIRSYHLLRHLAKSHRVWLATVADVVPSEETKSELRRLTEDFAYAVPGPLRWPRAAAFLAFGRSATEGAFASRRLQKTIDAWRRTVKFDATIAYCSSAAQYLPDGVPAFVDLTDVDSEKWLEFAKNSAGPKRLLHRLEGGRVRRLETLIGARAEMLALSTTPEVELYRRFAPHANAVAIPNGVDSEYFSPSTACGEPEVCTFVGAMDYRPNVDGCVWFVREVWPRLRVEFPEAKFRIVGRNPAKAVAALALTAGVEVVGGVPDVRPWLATSTAVVAPLAIARGVQNKVLEALSMSRPVVASPGAVGGLETTAGRDLLVADNPGDWVANIGRIWRDAELGARLGAAGRRYVLDHHCWDDCLSPWDEHLDRVRGRSDATVVAGAAG